MEANTTMTICPNCRQPYDTARYSKCPQCGAAASFPHTEPIGGGASFTATEPIGGGASFIATEPIGGGASFTATEPIHGSAAGANVNAGFNPTVPPEMSDAFMPTMAGDMLTNGNTTDPVVGWLVCIEGPAQGEDYRVHAGYNYIGRNTGDICIRGDNQISRQNHAMIAFDSSDMIFFVGPANGKNLIKVNGKTVFNPVEIHSYDTISIGTTKLIFVALCGERFNWATREIGDAK